MSDFVKVEQVIGSRYRLVEKDIDQLPYSGVSVWRANDTTLKNSVRILVLDPHGQNFAEALDAAKRASLFEDAHAVKILSVDSDSHHGWIVTEIPLGIPLSYRLHGDAFPPEQAKALVGEVARVISAAAAQGIRHLDVRPSDIYVDSQGQVFIDGLGVHAALAGIRSDTDMPYELDRKEAAGLSLLYARLLSGDANSSADDVLKRVSHNENIEQSLRFFFEKAVRGAGALSASDVIRHLGSYPAVSVGDLPAIPGTHTQDETPENMDEELGIPSEPALSSAPTWQPTHAGKEGGTETHSPSNDTTYNNSQEENSNSSKKNDTAVGTDADNTDSTAQGSSTSSSENTGDNVSSEKNNFLKTIASKTSQSSKELSAKTVSGISSVASSKAVRGTIKALERQMDKVSEVSEDDGVRRFNTGSLFTAISIGLVVVAGIWAFSLFFSAPTIEGVEQGPTGPAVVDGDSDSDSTTAQGTVNPLIESVTVLNPQAGNIPTSEGVQQDNPDTVANLIDGDTSTVWQSWWYPTAQFTIGKDWLGLQIKLKEPTTVENVYMQVNGNGGLVQWRIGEDANPDNTQLVSESLMSTATHLVAPEPVATDVITLWVRELPKDKVQKNRVVIAEIDINR